MKLRLAFTAMAVAVALGLISSAAMASTHSVNYFRHGIIEDCCINGGVGFRALIEQQRYDSSGFPYQAQLWAGMFHYTSTGNWAQQCYVYTEAGWYLDCIANEGTQPCTKYAWTAGQSPANGTLAWHGHRAAYCG